MITTRDLILAAFNGAYARLPTAAEFGQWRSSLNMSYLISGTQQLTDAKARVSGLFPSAEYIARSRTTTQYVYDLYLAYFNRVPNSTDLAFWVAAIGGGDRSASNTDFSNMTEFSDRVAITLPVLQYPTEDIEGPPILKFLRADDGYDEIVDTHQYDDGTAKYYTKADTPMIRWELTYDGLHVPQSSILDQHRDDAFGSVFGFDFRDRDTGILYTDVHYDNSGGGSSGGGSGTPYTPDHGKTWVQSRIVLLIKRPS